MTLIPVLVYPKPKLAWWTPFLFHTLMTKKWRWFSILGLSSFFEVVFIFGVILISGEILGDDIKENLRALLIKNLKPYNIIIEITCMQENFSVRFFALKHLSFYYSFKIWWPKCWHFIYVHSFISRLDQARI